MYLSFIANSFFFSLLITPSCCCGDYFPTHIWVCLTLLLPGFLSCLPRGFLFFWPVGFCFRASATAELHTRRGRLWAPCAATHAMCLICFLDDLLYSMHTVWNAVVWPLRAFPVVLVAFLFSCVCVHGSSLHFALRIEEMAGAKRLAVRLVCVLAAALCCTLTSAASPTAVTWESLMEKFQEVKTNTAAARPALVGANTAHSNLKSKWPYDEFQEETEKKALQQLRLKAAEAINAATSKLRFAAKEQKECSTLVSRYKEKKKIVYGPSFLTVVAAPIR